MDKAIDEGNLRYFLDSQDPSYLKMNVYKVDTGEYVSLLAYLIEKDAENGINISEVIEYLIRDKEISLNAGNPLHFLLKKKKLTLLPYFLEDDDGKQIFKKKINLSNVDTEGFTLIARAIAAQQHKLIPSFSARHLRTTTNISVNGESTPLLPLQQAILENKDKTISELITLDPTSINAPCKFADNAFFLAARFAKINALDTLVKKNPNFDLNTTNSDSERLIDLLCENLVKGENVKAAIAGISILLSRGAEVPRDKNHRDLLTKHRFSLLREVRRYTTSSPQLAANFVRACHNKNGPLHEIIYARHSWTESFCRFFGVVDKEALFVEKIVKDHHDSKSFDEHELAFMQFVIRYHEDFRESCCPNRWSTMRFNLACGNVTSMNEVEKYCAESKGGTRTERILNDNKSLPSIHSRIL